MKNQFYIIITTILFTMTTVGCDRYGSKPDYEPYATEILSVTVEPNPVIQGDTATFTCIIRDSLANDVSYRWSFGGTSLRFNTTSNRLGWHANVTPGRYSVLVSVSRPLPYKSVDKFVSIIVYSPNTQEK